MSCLVDVAVPVTVNGEDADVVDDEAKPRLTAMQLQMPPA